MEVVASHWVRRDHGSWENGRFRIGVVERASDRFEIEDVETGARWQERIPLDGYAQFQGVVAWVLEERGGEFPFEGLEEFYERESGALYEAWAEAEASEAKWAETRAQLAHVEQAHGVSASELKARLPERLEWLVPGVLHRNWTTKLAAREKGGKGSFSFYLIGCLEKGEPTVFGATQRRKVRTVVLTEEPQESLCEKLDAFGVDDAYIVEAHTWSGLAWVEKVRALVDIAVAGGYEIIFVDNISRAAGIEDESGVDLARAVEQLSDCAKGARIAVLLNHHHRKAKGAVQDMSRGGTGTAAATDINIEMERVGGWKSRVRRLSALGRVSASIWVQTIELNEAGDGYDVVEAATGDGELGWQEQTADRLTLEEMGQATVKEFAAAMKLGTATARRRLKRLVEAGLVTEERGERGEYIFRPALQDCTS